MKEQVLKASGIIKVQKLETQEVGTLNGFSMGRFLSRNTRGGHLTWFEYGKISLKECL